jgi:hypothetical protein
MKKSGDSPQRRFPRRSFEKPVGVLTGGQYSITKSTEVGEGGISFNSEYALQLNDQVVVTFKVPGADFVAVRATIKNIRPAKQQGHNNYGCAFNNIEPDKKRLLRAFISSQLN